MFSLKTDTQETKYEKQEESEIKERDRINTEPAEHHQGLQQDREATTRAESRIQDLALRTRSTFCMTFRISENKPVF